MKALTEMTGEELTRARRAATGVHKRRMDVKIRATIEATEAWNVVRQIDQERRRRKDARQQERQP